MLDALWGRLTDWSGLDYVVVPLMLAWAAGLFFSDAPWTVAAVAVGLAILFLLGHNKLSGG